MGKMGEIGEEGRTVEGADQEDFLSRSRDGKFYSDTFDLCFGNDDVTVKNTTPGNDVIINIDDDHRSEEGLHLGDEEKLEENEKAEKPKKKVLSVIGSGDYGRAIAGRIAQCDYTVFVGSRDPSNPDIRNLLSSKPGTRLVSQDQAMRESEVILVAVGKDHYAKLPSHLLRGKVLIDVANNTTPRSPDQPSNAEMLQALLPKSQVVKAFNVLSAYALENSQAQGSKEIPIASDNEHAKRVVMDLARAMGYNPVDRGALTNAREIEAIPLKLLPNWKTPFRIVAGMWFFHYLLLLAKFQICENVSSSTPWNWSSFRHLGLLNANRTSAITALWTLASCYLPGVIAAYTQLAWGTKYRRFPSWLDAWLRMRKQLGLLMFALGAMHTILGTAVWSAHYDKFMWEAPTLVRAEVQYNDTVFVRKEVPIFDSQMTWQGELFITAGAISIFLTCILAVTSLPSVGAALSWREFMFVQSKLGWMALLMGTLHNGLLGFGFSKEDFTCSLPSGAQYALHVPCLVILLKLPLLCPCVDRRLQRIRQGHDRPGAKHYGTTGGGGGGGGVVKREPSPVAARGKRRKRVQPMLVQPFAESFRNNGEFIVFIIFRFFLFSF
ncbi:metalloreductase STEAP4-like [Oratosquilla oratoria]|uniref:metalloreductase STEAP4-like n=1 Tax=Oratosquilla oratoria TaxID=337810 RepID=UPI003F777877